MLMHDDTKELQPTKKRLRYLSRTSRRSPCTETSGSRGSLAAPTFLFDVSCIAAAVRQVVCKNLEDVGEFASFTSGGGSVGGGGG